MAWQVLIQSDVELYVTITKLLDEADVELHWWKGLTPDPDTDFDVFWTAGATSDRFQVVTPDEVYLVRRTFP